MAPKSCLPVGGIAIAGPSGSGKSSGFFGSDLVRGCVLADTGSQGHDLFWKHDRADILYIDNSPTCKDGDPVAQVIKKIREWKDRGIIAVVDSFTTLIEHQCVYIKQQQRPNVRGELELSQYNYKGIVARFRDLALILSQHAVFTIFNTAPGGIVRLPDGTMQETPKGSIVALPALTGVGNGSESILARWTSVYVCTAGGEYKDRDGNTQNMPRGFFVPSKDARPAAVKLYTPLKDPAGVLEETGDQKIHVLGPPIGQRDHKEVAIDLLLRKMAEKYPNRCSFEAAPAAQNPPVAPTASSSSLAPAGNKEAVIKEVERLAIQVCGSWESARKQYAEGLGFDGTRAKDMTAEIAVKVRDCLREEFAAGAAA